MSFVLYSIYRDEVDIRVTNDKSETAHDVARDDRTNDNNVPLLIETLPLSGLPRIAASSKWFVLYGSI